MRFLIRILSTRSFCDAITIKNNIAYDNILTCKETRKEMERTLESLRYALKKRGIKVSRSKTEYLCINGGNDDETVKMKDTKVPRVKEFKYLGSTCKKWWL